MNFILKLLGLVPKIRPSAPVFCQCERCTSRRMLSGTQFASSELNTLEALAKAKKPLEFNAAPPLRFSHFVDTRPLHRSFAAQRIQIISTQLGELDEELRAARAPTVRASIDSEMAMLRHELRELRKEYEL